MLVGGGDDLVVPDGAAGLGDVLGTGFEGTLHVVAKGEEGVGAHGHAGHLGDPVLFLLLGEHVGLYLEGVLPHALGQHVVVLLGDVQVDGVVPVGAADAVHELEAQHLRVLAQPPDVRLVARQPGAVDAALLARAHAKGLSALDVAHRVGLGVFQRDEGQQHIVLGLLGQIAVFGDDIFQHLLVNRQIIVPLLEGDAEDAPPLDGGGGIIGVDLHHVVAAFALGFEDFQRLVGVAGGDDAVGHLQGQEPGGVGVAGVGQCRPVAEGAQTVGAPGPDVGAGNGGEVAVRRKVDVTLHVAERQAQGGPGGGDVLEGGGGGQAGGLFQGADQLPGVQRVHEVDVPRLAVEHLQGQLAVFHEDAGGLLVGVAAVFQFQLGHVQTSSLPVLIDDGSLVVPGLQVDIPHEQGHLVVVVQR